MFLFSNIACVSKGKTVTISHTLRKRNRFLIENKQRQFENYTEREFFFQKLGVFLARFFRKKNVEIEQNITNSIMKKVGVEKKRGVA